MFFKNYIIRPPRKRKQTRYCKKSHKSCYGETEFDIEKKNYCRTTHGRTDRFLPKGKEGGGAGRVVGRCQNGIQHRQLINI